MKSKRDFKYVFDKILIYTIWLKKKKKNGLEKNNHIYSISDFFEHVKIRKNLAPEKGCIWSFEKKINLNNTFY